MRIRATAPCRINDIGGWTDTRFAKYGAVCSIAIEPRVEVEIDMVEPEDPSEAHIIISIYQAQNRTRPPENYGEVWDMDDEWFGKTYPLIKETIALTSFEETACNINIYSDMPAGASTGTSAATMVALYAGMCELIGTPKEPTEIASAAHRIETSLGLESGVQDQVASALGGVQFMTFDYPDFKSYPIAISQSILYELDQRLILAYMGEPHNSSEIHKSVIDELGEDAAEHVYIRSLRIVANDAATALKDGDLKAYGRCMYTNTSIQRVMHYSLISPAADEIIDIADHYNVLGCKVNGAGGDGGTVTILTDGDARKKRLIISELGKAGFQTIPVRISHDGLRVWWSE